MVKDDTAHELICSAGGRVGDFQGLHTVSGVNGTPYPSFVPGDNPTSIYTRNQRVEWGAVSSNTDPLLGMVWPDELRLGEINHRTTMVLSCNGEGISSDLEPEITDITKLGYVYPTTHGALRCDNMAPEDGGPTTMADRSANGYIWRLKYTESEIDDLALPTWQAGLLKMFRKYGCVVTDTGGSGVSPVRGLSGRTWTSFGFDDPYFTWAYDEWVAGDPHINMDSDGQMVLRLRDGWDPYAWEVLRPAEGVTWRS